MLRTKPNNINGPDGIEEGRDVPKHRGSIKVGEDTDLKLKSSKNSSAKARAILDRLNPVAMELVVPIADDTLVKFHNQAVLHRS